MWKKHIDSDLIEAFMDRMFETYRYSFHDMENALKDFAYNGEICNDAICEDCKYIKALDDRMDSLNDLRKKAIQEKNIALKELDLALKDRDKILKERNEVRNDSKRNRDLYVAMKEKYKQLKENSVIFSMEEREW